MSGCYGNFVADVLFRCSSKMLASFYFFVLFYLEGGIIKNYRELFLSLVLTVMATQKWLGFYIFEIMHTQYIVWFILALFLLTAFLLSQTKGTDEGCSPEIDKDVCVVKTKPDEFASTVIQLRMAGLFFSILLMVLPLYHFGYGSAPVSFGGNSWVEHKYSDFELIYYQMLPGITFTSYFVFFFLGKSALKTKIRNTLLLLFIYFLVYVISTFTLGIFAALAGGFAALLIKDLLPQKHHVKNWLLFLIGFLAGTIGVFLAYGFSEPADTEFEGLTILLSCVPWQLCMGVLFTLLCNNNRKLRRGV